MSCLQQRGNDCILTVRVTPRASQNRIEGVVEDALRIRLQSPPVDGKANKALLKFLGNLLRLPSSRIQLLSGDKSRVKRILLVEYSVADATNALDILDR